VEKLFIKFNFNPDYALGIVARRKRAKKTRAFEGLFGDAIVTLW